MVKADQSVGNRRMVVGPGNVPVYVTQRGSAESGALYCRQQGI